MMGDRNHGWTRKSGRTRRVCGVATPLLSVVLSTATLALLAASPTPALAQTGNTPPYIIMDRFMHHYTATMNVNITVDLRGVAGDREDGPDTLEWFVDAKTLEHAQFGYLNPDSKQVLVFTPVVGFLGSDEVNIDVKDSGGLSARASITLTWQDPIGPLNLPPMILRDRLLTKVGGLNASVCYDLRDKAADPDDPAASLRWSASGYDTADMTVRGMDTRELCFTPIRYNFAGCVPAKFIVRDPRGKEDSYTLPTCWRKIEVGLPMVVHGVTVRR